MASPNLLAGKAQAALTNITRFTQTTKRSTRNGLEHGQYFAASTTPARKEALRFDRDFVVSYASISPDGTFTAVTLPRLTVLPTGALPVVGISVSDDMERIQPASIDPIYFGRSVITLVGFGDAVKFSLPFISNDLNDPVDMPPAGTPPAEEGEDPVPGAGIARLNWIDLSANDPNNLPVFAALPILCPLDHGSSGMPWGSSVADPIPADAELSPLVRAWATSMRHLFLTNAGRSHHDAGATFFDGNSIQLAHAEALAAFTNITLASTFTVTTAALSPRASTDLFDRCESLREAVWFSLAPNTPPPHPPTPGGGSPLPVPVDHDYSKLAAAFRSPLSRKDLEAIREQEASTNIYRLLTCRPGPINPATGLPSFVLPGDLREEFVEGVLAPSKHTTVVDNLRKLFVTHSTKFKDSDLAFNKAIDYHQSVFDIPLASAYKRADWSTVPLAQDHSMLTHAIFLFTCLPVVTTSTQWKERQSVDLVSHMEDNVGQPASLRARKPTSLFVDGEQTSSGVITSMLATMACHLDMFCKAAPESVAWLYLLKFFNMLTTQEALNWISQLQHVDRLRLIHNLVMDLSTFFTCLVKFATNPAYLKALVEKSDIDYKALEPLNTYFIHISNRVSECIVHMNLGTFYGNTSATMSLFPSFAATLASFVPAAEAKTPPAKRPASGSAQESPRTPDKRPKASSPPGASGSEPARDNSRAKAAGLLKLTSADAKLPVPRHLVHDKKRICMNFITHGFYCRFTGKGKECYNLHPAKLEDLPTPIRDPFITWVASTDDIDWVPGKGPAGTV